MPEAGLDQRWLVDVAYLMGYRRNSMTCCHVHDPKVQSLGAEQKVMAKSRSKAIVTEVPSGCASRTSLVAFPAKRNDRHKVNLPL